MKNVKKFMSLVICVCQTRYGFPVFASQSVNDSELDVQMVMLTDSEMKELVGAMGSLDVNVADYARGDTETTVVFANRTSGYTSYSILAGNYGTGGSVIGSGQMSPNSAKVVTVPVPYPDGTYSIAAELGYSGLSLRARDVSNR